MKLSIITSVLNEEHSIQKTINSLTPLPEGVEHIFVDGGSTDSTRDFCPPWSVFVDGSGTSLYEAFNLGIDNAKGEFIYFLNGGDEIISIPLLEAMVDFLEDEDVYYFDTVGPWGTEFTVHMERLPYQMPFSHQGCMMRKDKMGRFATDKGITADFHLIVRCWMEGLSFDFIPLTLTQCAPFGSTESTKKRDVERYRSVMDLARKYQPQRVYEYELGFIEMYNKRRMGNHS